MSQFLRRYLQAFMDAGSLVGLVIGTVGIPVAALAFVCSRVFG